MSFATRHIFSAAVLGLLSLQAWAGTPIEEGGAGADTLRIQLAADESQGKPDTGDLPLTGAEWHLTKVIFDGAVSGLEYGSGSPVTIRFDKSGRVSGRGPVNRFTGSARWSSDGQIAWVGAGPQTTRMAGPPEAMEREDLFFQILGQVQRHRISDSQLILETDDTNSSLTFER